MHDITCGWSKNTFRDSQRVACPSVGPRRIPRGRRERSHGAGGCSQQLRAHVLGGAVFKFLQALLGAQTRCTRRRNVVSHSGATDGTSCLPERMAHHPNVSRTLQFVQRERWVACLDTRTHGEVIHSRRHKMSHSVFCSLKIQRHHDTVR